MNNNRREQSSTMILIRLKTIPATVRKKALLPSNRSKTNQPQSQINNLLINLKLKVNLARINKQIKQIKKIQTK